MRIFTNLPVLLRSLFGLLRFVTILLAVFWTLSLVYNTWIQQHFGPATRFIATVGEISLPAKPGQFALSSDTAEAGSLAVNSLRGTLQVDLASQDSALGSALRRAIIPPMAVLLLFSYVLFSALRKVCDNLACGEVFSEENIRLVRRIGVSLIAYALGGAALELWASHVLGDYFSSHVVLTGLQASLAFPAGTNVLNFSLPDGLITTQGGLLIGCLVLLVAEAFRQGLVLKAENDLTV